MDYRAPKHRTANFRLTHFSGMLLCLLALTGCQSQSGITEAPAKFSINNTRVIDSPNRYGGSASEETLKQIEQRIQDYGLHADDVWFIYLRATNDFDHGVYYSEIYLLPRQLEGRLYEGEFIVFRTEALDEKWAQLSEQLGESGLNQVHPYVWVKPQASASLADGLESISLNSLPTEPAQDFPPEKIIQIVDFLRTAPRVPGTLKDGDEYQFIHVPEQKIKPDLPIWKLEGTPENPEILILESDRRRKRVYTAKLLWTNDRYELESVGLLGISTGWFMQY